MRVPVCIAAMLLCATTAAQAGAQRAELDDEALQRAFGYLTRDEQADWAAEFGEETRHLDSFQRKLIDYARGILATDPGLLPRAVDAPAYDPKLHAPGQPIARRVLKPDDAAVGRTRASFFEHRARGAIASEWAYDWGTRAVVRDGKPDDPERMFAEALLGAPPDAALAEAIVESVLDTGGESKTLSAFAHAYTDRSGNVFTGLTLYDAWSSGAEIEMPDVDVLGLVHDVLGERERWKAPIPEAQHRAIYDEVAKLYQRAHHYRGLRTALAWTFVRGASPLDDGYVGHRLRFHGLWESVSSVPSELAARLPDAEHWSEWLQSMMERFDSDGEATLRAQTRQSTLESDGSRVRAIAVRILREKGALERKSRPEPKKAATPTGG